MMRGKYLFLQWSLFASLIAAAAIIGWAFGWFGRIFHDDETHITLVTLTVFVFTTGWCGSLSWRFVNGRDPAVIERSLASGWFASSVCVTLGLLGTVVGYYLMMRHVSGNDANAAEQLVSQIRSGMGTVLINTIVGGFCGLLIELQSHFIGQTVRRSIPANRVKP